MPALSRFDHFGFSIILNSARSISHVALRFLPVYTSVELFGRFLPLRCARNEAPTGSNAGLGLALMALNVADIAPWNYTKTPLHLYCFLQLNVSGFASFIQIPLKFTWWHNLENNFTNKRCGNYYIKYFGLWNKWVQFRFFTFYKPPNVRNLNYINESKIQ